MLIEIKTVDSSNIVSAYTLKGFLRDIFLTSIDIDTQENALRLEDAYLKLKDKGYAKVAGVEFIRLIPTV